MLRVWISRADDNTRNSACNDVVNARPSTSARGAWLERDVKSGRADIGYFAQTFHFGVRTAGLAMKAAGDNFALFHQNGAHSGVGAGETAPFVRLRKCSAH